MKSACSLPGFQNPSKLLLKTSPIAFWGGSTGKSRTPWAKYHVFGGKPRTWQHCSLQTWCFLWRLLRCLWLEAELLRLIRVCQQSTARALRERTSPYAFSRRTLMSYMIDRQVEHTSSFSRVTWQIVITASAVENCVFSYREIIANAINYSALICSLFLDPQCSFSGVVLL